MISEHKQKPGISAKIRNTIAQRFDFSAQVSGQELGMTSIAKSIDEELPLYASVRGEMAALGSWGQSIQDFSSKTHAVDLIGKAEVTKLTIPEKKEVRVKQEKLLQAPYLLSLDPSFPISGRCIAPCGLLELPDISAPELNFPTRLGNRMLFSEMLKKPIVLQGIDPHLLPTPEYDSFVREAEISKGVPESRCELLAIFRNLPVEMISHLRFIAEKNRIVFQISPDVCRTTTRLHDLAAVRDSATEEIHLISHRLRFKSVCLN
jgi:hypothetical protein